LKKTWIVIAGGGFAGLYAAIQFDKRLARLLVNEHTRVRKRCQVLAGAASALANSGHDQP
jgi:2-polyprenyl-6-methoxyphenol hydroxylase-like FAD-dependent oxidoreductase